MKIRIKRNGRNHFHIHNLKELTLQSHKENKGKVEVIGKVPVRNLEDLTVYYTPGVQYASLAIRENKEDSYLYTARGNRIAILCDGSRVLGLGDIGPEAGLPVMEGKALLFKKFGDVDAIPLTVSCKAVDEIVAVAKAIEPSIGGINIEDISTPKCFDIFDRLQKELSIPVFHDDRHGTAVVTLSALKNALSLVGKDLKTAKIVINGIGSAGVGIAELLLAAGAENLMLVDRRGILYKGRADNMNRIKSALSEHTNGRQLKGQLQDAVKSSDVLIGVSEKGAFNERLIKSMASRPIVFALANPEPEMDYSEAKSAGAEIVATGASNRPNQVNNLLAFPAIFRGALDVNARKINTAMLLAASEALTESIPKNRLDGEHIIPNFAIDDIDHVTASIAVAVAKAAIETGVARKKIDPKTEHENVKLSLKRYSKIEKTVAKLGKKKRLAKLFKKKSE